MSDHGRKPHKHRCPECGQEARFLERVDHLEGTVLYCDRPLYVCDHGCKGPDGGKLRFVTYKDFHSGKRRKAVVRDEVPK